MITLGEPLIQSLEKEELEIQIDKYLKILVNRFDNLKRKDIEDLVVELNNLWFEFLKKENGENNNTKTD